FHARLRTGRQFGMLRRLHPALDFRRSATKRVHSAENFEACLLGAAMAEVLGHRANDGFTCPREHCRRACQTIPSCRDIGNTVLRLRCALELDEAVELSLEISDHLSTPSSKVGKLNHHRPRCAPPSTCSTSPVIWLASVR